MRTVYHWRTKFLWLSVGFFLSFKEIEVYQLLNALSALWQSFRQLGKARLRWKLPIIGGFLTISGSFAHLGAHQTMPPAPRPLESAPWAGDLSEFFHNKMNTWETLSWKLWTYWKAIGSTISDKPQNTHFSTTKSPPLQVLGRVGARNSSFRSE